MLSHQPAIEVGRAVGEADLPLTLEAETPEAIEQLHQWLRDLPGIQFIDVVCVFF